MLSKDFHNNTVHHVYFFMQDYDAHAIREYAPFIEEKRAEIPYGSFRSIYQAPDGETTVFGPAVKYDWAARLKRQK